MIIVSAETATVKFFCKRKVIFLGKLIISKFFTLAHFSRETTKALAKVQFLKSHFLCGISIGISFNIINVPSALAGAPIVFY